MSFETLARWLALAPDPAPLPADKKWHVFISYRSADRAWAMSLYDVLVHLEYKAFFDQFALSPADQLALTLGDALDQSTAGIVIWSANYKNSEWTKTELNNLTQRELDGTGFRYVIAKIDGAEVKGLPRGKIQVDFSASREGPTGSNLLRLLYGLHGQPMSPDAVHLAEQVDEQTRHALAAIAAARSNGDADELLRLTAAEDLAWQTSPLLGCAAAESLISLDRSDAALGLLEQLIARFPKSPRPQQLLGLAYRRQKNWREAQKVLGRLYESMEMDSETLGIYAATWMQRYQAEKNKLFLRRSRDLYLKAFETTPSDYYTGINAASKSLLLGEKDRAAQLAARVEALVGTKAVSDDYWLTATAAEVQLLQTHYESASRLYECAVSDKPLAVGDHRSTWNQAAALLEALAASSEDCERIRSVFAHLD